MYRIIFFDIDGTLRDEKLGVEKRNIDALKKCKEKGYYTCLCTGRTKGTIQEDVLSLEIDGIISGGGSHIEFKENKIKEKYFEEEDIENVFLYLKNSKDTAFTFESDDIVFMNENALKIFNFENEKKFGIDNKDVLEREKIIYRNNINEFNSKEYKINKICLWSKVEVFNEIKNKHMNNKIQLAQSYKYNDTTYYEIIQKNCNKGQAIQELCDFLNIEMNETMAFGDGKNDMDMFKVVGTAVGVRNGDKEILKYTDSICEEPKNGGIYLELKKRMII